MKVILMLIIEMKKQAAESKIGAKLLFLPYLLGERAPFMDLNAKATFFGVGRDTMKSDFLEQSLNQLLLLL